MQVLAELLAATKEGSTGTPGLLASAEGGVIRIEEAFAGLTPGAMRIFLRAAYGTEGIAEAIEAAAAADDYEVIVDVVALADQLAAPGILAALDAGVAAALPSNASEVDAWLLLLRTADVHQAQLPKAYQAAVGMAVKAMAASCAGTPAGGLPMQLLCVHEDASKLSAGTLMAILGGLVSAARGVSSTAQLTASTWSTAAAQPGPIHGGPFSGSYTVSCSCCICFPSSLFIRRCLMSPPPPVQWHWEPGFGLQDERAKRVQRSPSFTVGGVRWRLDAHLNGDWDEDKGHVSISLAPLAEGSVAQARHLDYTITVKSRKGCESDATRTSRRRKLMTQTWGWPQFVSHEGKFLHHLRCQASWLLSDQVK